MAKCAIISPQLLLHCLYSMGGLSNTFIYLFYLKTSKPQNLALLDNYISSVSYADTFSFRSKVNTLKPRSAREKEKAAF